MTRSTFILLTGSKSDIDEVGGNGCGWSTLGHSCRIWRPVKITYLTNLNLLTQKSLMAQASLSVSRPSYHWRRTIGIVTIDEVVSSQIARVFADRGAFPLVDSER